MRSAYLFAPTLILVFATGAFADNLAYLSPLYNPTEIASRLNDPKVKNELKITKEQEKGIKACVDQWGKAMGRDLEVTFKWTGPDKPARVRALGTQRSEELLRSLGQVLKPAQVKRLKQILLQQLGITVFNHPEIRQALKLSDQQAATLKTTFEKLRNDLALEVKAGRISRQDGQKQYFALGKGVPDPVRATLTEQQRKTLNDLLGEPYRFD